jgi:hypothetical protein
VRETAEDRERDARRRDYADRYEGADMRVDSHWSEKRREDMTERDWRIFRWGGAGAGAAVQVQGGGLAPCAKQAGRRAPRAEAGSFVLGEGGAGVATLRQICLWSAPGRAPGRGEGLAALMAVGEAAALAVHVHLAAAAHLAFGWALGSRARGSRAAPPPHLHHSLP